MRYVDRQVDRIVDWLRSGGRWNDTILIVTADHGEALHDRGAYAHPQYYTYDEPLNVPLVARVPGYDGRRVDAPFSLGWLHDLVTDLTETSALDAPLTSPYDSRVPITEPPENLPATVLADSLSPRGHSVAGWRDKAKHVVQTHDLADATVPNVQPTGTYQLERNPNERTRSDDVETELRRVAQDLTVSPDELRAEAGGDTASEAAKDSLRQLGYAE